MKSKITTGIAMTGLLLVLVVILSRLIYPLPFELRSALLVIGFTLMLLGTLWRVVTDMNDNGKKH